MLWFGSKISSINQESMIFRKCLIKPLLLVKTFEEKCLQKVLQSYPEPYGNFEQIRIFFIHQED